VETSTGSSAESSRMSRTPADSPTRRTAIVLSAGYFGFFAHAGFMRAVEELGIDYCAISGSSAGAIVAALHASGVPAQEIIDLLLSVRRRDFWDRAGMGTLLKAALRKGRGWTGLLKGDRLERLIEGRLRVNRFELCPRALYVNAFNLTTGTDETFYSGTIADKVRASCSYPFLLTAKVMNGSTYWDGGFLSKVPIETMAASENPDRFLIHYLPTRTAPRQSWSPVSLLEAALTAARKEIEEHRLNALAAIRDRITWVVPSVPGITPRDFSNARAAVDAAYYQALESLRHVQSKSALSETGSPI
jgi:NTE family protein